MIKEDRVNAMMKLSTSQKQVLCKIASSGDPKLAGDSLEGDLNLKGAATTLASIGMITVQNGTVDITDAGIQAMKEEGLIDDNNQLTPQGQQFTVSQHDQKMQQQMMPKDQQQPQQAHQPMESILFQIDKLSRLIHK